MDAIYSRRSIGKVKQEPVARELIERILDAAVRAPNHRRTEPWRFFVMTGEGRSRLGEAYADIYRAEHPDADEVAAAKQRLKAYRAPVVIAVACEPSTLVGVIEQEEVAAVCAGIQNMLLTAQSLGLGAIWRTGEPAYTIRMNEAFGISPRGKVVGLIYIGEPNMVAPDAWRTPSSQKTVWIEEGQSKSNTENT